MLNRQTHLRLAQQLLVTLPTMRKKYRISPISRHCITALFVCDIRQKLQSKIEKNVYTK